LIVQKDNVVDRLLIGEITNYNSVDLIKGAFFKQRTIKKVKGTSGDRYSIDSDVFQPLENPKVRQGYYEASNIDVAKELVNMPMISKKYDANSKALQIIKRSRKSSLEMGRPQ